MNGPSRPSQTRAVVVVLLRAGGRGPGQCARYLGPLSLEADSLGVGADPPKTTSVQQDEP
jgi:hypothetical protein